MKKLIFILLAMVLVTGAVFAVSPVQPFGGYSLEITMAEISINDDVIAQPSVLSASMFCKTELDSIQTVVVNDSLITTQPQQRGIICSLIRKFRALDYGHSRILFALLTGNISFISSSPYVSQHTGYFHIGRNNFNKIFYVILNI